MITRLKFTDGYATKLKCCQKEFHFERGVNILFGDNGTGKSTILKTIAGYGLTKNGWTNIEYPISACREDGGLFGKNEKEPSIDYLISSLTEGLKADNDLNGAVFIDYGKSEDGDYRNANMGFGAGTLSFAGNIIRRFDNANKSTGEIRKNDLKSLYETLSYRWCIPEEKYLDEEKSEYWREGKKFVRDYLVKVITSDVNTLLFDEPEMNLSVKATIKFYQNLVGLSKYYQIIVASHYPLVLFNPDYNIISMSENYTNYCKREMKKVFNLR